MTTLETIGVAVIWVGYGTLNAYQHNWHIYEVVDPLTSEEKVQSRVFTYLNILFAPVALGIRIFRGVFLWKGDYLS